jgi:hypothetical protein
MEKQGRVCEFGDILERTWGRTPDHRRTSAYNTFEPVVQSREEPKITASHLPTLDATEVSASRHMFL